MRVLLIGSGGREHAIAQRLLASPLLSTLEVAPGNPGTAAHNIELDVNDHDAVTHHCISERVDLVVVGPEQPLVEGLADRLRERGVSCFGPSAAAAQLEGSKAFARDFAGRHGIPGPQYKAFSDVDEAIAWLDEVGVDVVVKADGLAGGKGVVIPESRAETESAIRDMLASPGASLVLEERMTGEELSIFAVVSGDKVDSFGAIAAQDHKRVGDGDTGPNTGGMGAFAPVPGLAPELLDEIVDTFLVRAATGMVADGTPYVGVLYGGVMLTPQGPRLVEYNCRLGDPEAQVILPLVTSDLLDVFHAAATDQSWPEIERKPDEVAATVVVAAEGYPAQPTTGIAIPEVEVPAAVTVYQAGTRLDGDSLVSSGGRVLTVTGRGATLDLALDAAYGVVHQITGAGLFARSDIGWRRREMTSNNNASDDAAAYAASGVSLSAGAESNARIAASVKSTHDARVVAGLGSFGGVFDIAAAKDMDQPLLVATTDGVGTKTVLAEKLDRWEGCGADIVNHGIDDVLVQNARPLFFLDTVAAAQLDPEIVGRIVDGMAEACRDGDVVLLGGETAEMPGVLTDGSVDIAGTLVGIADAANLLPKPGIAAGDQLIGIASSGLHTNGYSLARMVTADMDLNDPLPGGDGESIGDALLAVHRNYLPVLQTALDAGNILGLAHITGGGLIDNLPRILPDGCGADIDTNTWPTPPLFQFLIDGADLGVEEAHRILNCGIGMVAVVKPDDVASVQAAIDEPTWLIGSITDSGAVTLT